MDIVVDVVVVDVVAVVVEGDVFSKEVVIGNVCVVEVEIVLEVVKEPLQKKGMVVRVDKMQAKLPTDCVAEY